MNISLDYLLTKTQQIMREEVKPNNHHYDKVYVGVDLGTAYTVVIVLDENKQPIAGCYEFAQVVRDGLIVDFNGAVDLTRKLKQKVEKQLGFELYSAASGYPPGVPMAEVRATAYVLNAAGFECTGLLDEPSAANNVLQIDNGAIVDIGGGTTGIAIVRDGKVIYTADEPTGGTHFSLVIAGANNISFEQAESLKIKPENQSLLFPLVRPVMEKVASIIIKHINGQSIPMIYLVGGTSAFQGIAEVIHEYTDIKTTVPVAPVFVTPLGIAMYNEIREN